MPQIVINSPSLDLQMKIGIKIIGVKTNCAAKSLYQFWEEIYKVFSSEVKAEGKEKVFNMLVNNRYASESLKLMMNCIVEDYPSRIVRDYIEDVFTQVFKNLREPGVEWMTEALQNIPQSILNNGEKNSFISNMKVKSADDHSEYYTDFFEKFEKRCKAHNLKKY